jgi:hypothetical protein
MKNDAMSKLSAGFLVLVMALSALVLFPMGNEGQTTSSANIYVPVISSGSPVPDAWVNLTEVHTGDVITAQYSVSKSAYVATNPPSGYYLVSVIDADHLDMPAAAEVSFDGRTNVTVSPPVDLTALPSKTFSIEVTVVDSTATVVTGAYVSVYDNTAHEFVSFATTATNITGKATISMFNTNLIPSHTFYLVARKNMYEMNATAVTITASTPRTIQLEDSKRVTGFASDANGPAPGVVAYLINKDNSVPWVKRIMKVTGAALAFDAYDGNYVLVVDAEGDAADTQELTVAGAPVALSIPILGQQTKRVAQNNITYGSDFTSFTLNVTGDWPYDVAHPGLGYSDMGNLRMQVDLVLGNGNGVLDGTEVFDFTQMTYRWGMGYVATDGLLLLNDTVYYGSDFRGYPFQLADGLTVLDESSVPFSYEADYSAEVGAIDVGASDYSAIAYARYDTDELDNKYRIVLPTGPPGYELVSNHTQYTTVMGYLTITLDPPTGVSTREPIELDLQTHEKPSTTASLTVGPGVAYAETDANNTVIRYVVRVGSNITFSAADSYDPNENPLLYTWDFGDGSSPVTTPNETYIYKFANASEDRMVSLNVTDVSGMWNETEIKVVCDNLDPTPVITVSNQPIDMSDYSISVNQRDVVRFNATGSTDDAAAGGDPNGGGIDYIQFDYGEGNSSQRIYWTAADRNVTHTFADAGTWNVTLNVTDVTGHWMTKVIYVHVNDTTKPTVSFTVKNESGSATLVEKKNLSFDASGTTDNLDKNTTLKFEWDFGDGTWLNGTGTEFVNVTHLYTYPKSYTVSLNVTDTAGNHLKTPKVITVGQGTRPKITVDQIYYTTVTNEYKPGNFTEGKTGYIVLNMTNSGSIDATDITVSIYIIKADGTEELLGTSTDVRNATDGTAMSKVLVGEEAQIWFKHTFDAKGKYTIKVNVTANDQLTPTIYTSPDKLIVNEAGWKKWLLWGGVAAVLILVPLLIYVMSRWSKREKKGPRREKKEKPGASEEEL